jgi:alcohol dehydrogenase (cytochrome c)
VQVSDPGNAEVFTGAPLIVKDMVVTGMAGAEFGVRGWIEALDLNTGDRRWRTYTIPGPGEPGHETWKDNHGAWKTGGGTTWVTGSYDPDLNLIIWGTANPGPDWDAAYRPGDNLWTDSTLALDADTGKIVWGFQHTPNDPYDFDSISENTFVDTKINGKPARATLHANRNGFAYALDRETGKFLWGTQFVAKLNWTDGLDQNGKPVAYNPNVDVQTYNPGTAAGRGTATEGRGTIEGTLEPGHMGGKNWPPTTYSPQTNMYYIPVIEGCNKAYTEVTIPGQHKPRDLFLGGAPFTTYDDPNCGRIKGSITAIDVSTGKVVRKHWTKHPQLGGLLSTAGGLVFAGYAEGQVVALDANTLEELWRFETGSAINAPPMTFMSGNKQYVAIEVGLGGAWPQWFVSATPELKEQVPSNMLYVFELP